MTTEKVVLAVFLLLAGAGVALLGRSLYVVPNPTETFAIVRAKYPTGQVSRVNGENYILRTSDGHLFTVRLTSRNLLTGQLTFAAEPILFYQEPTP